MIKYGLDRVDEMKFASFQPTIEKRDDMWIDIELTVTLSPDTPVPDDLIDFSILVICAANGHIAQMVPLDEGCDCEYQFTPAEKDQLRQYIESPDIQDRIRDAVLATR